MEERMSKEGVKFFKSIIGIEFNEDSEYVQDFVSKYKANMEGLIDILESEKRTEIKTLTEKLDEIRKISNEKVPLFEKLTEEVKKLESKKRDLNADITDLNDLTLKIKEEIEGSKQRRETLTLEINDLETKKSEMLEDNQLALQEINKTKLELENLREDCFMSKNEININVYILKQIENKLSRYKLLSKILKIHATDDIYESKRLESDKA